ncbi:MAG TPA: class I SAM-dependent methyltransferase [Gammaproteobacteria bacterium]|nr:class I SAM-dependent methyltransferase [Gammaproteobacteria bacterium]
MRFEWPAWLGRLRWGKRHALVGRPDLWRMKRAFQLQFLRARGLQPGDSVLDIGCGSLRGGAALIGYLDAGRYVGVDVRESVMEEAHRELVRERLTGKEPRLVRVERLDELALEQRFDVIWAFSVLFHLSDDILPSCFAVAAKHLQPRGAFYANVILGEGPPGEWQGFPVITRSLAHYETAARGAGLQMSVVGKLAELGHYSGLPSQDEQTMLVFRQTG